MMYKNRTQVGTLRVLADCPNGATQDALINNAGCDLGTLKSLVKLGRVRRRRSTLANPPGLVVVRYSITDQGRAFLTYI
jgi:hypothetical protein